MPNLADRGQTAAASNRHMAIKYGDFAIGVALRTTKID